MGRGGCGGSAGRRRAAALRPAPSAATPPRPTRRRRSPRRPPTRRSTAPDSASAARRRRGPGPRPGAERAGRGPRLPRRRRPRRRRPALPARPRLDARAADPGRRRDARPSARPGTPTRSSSTSAGRSPSPSSTVDGERADFARGRQGPRGRGAGRGGRSATASRSATPARPSRSPAPTTRTDFNTLGWTVTDRGEAWTMQEPYGAYTWYAVNDQPVRQGALRLHHQHARRRGSASPTAELTIARATIDGDTVTRVAPRRAGVVVPRHGRGRRLRMTARPLRQRRADDLLDAARRRRRRSAACGRRPAGSTGSRTGSGRTRSPRSASSSSTPRAAWRPRRWSRSATNDYILSPEVIVHEMVHQWYGDQVTPGDWRDVWMYEGMTMLPAGDLGGRARPRPSQDQLDEWAGIDQELRDESGPPADYDPASSARPTSTTRPR